MENIIERWVAALRSGEYPQGHQTLCSYDRETGERTGYCCLGVLTHVVDPDHRSIKQWHGEEPELKGASISNCQMLATDIIARLEEETPLKCTMQHDIELIDGHLASILNDEGSSFDEIADLIEKTYLAARV